MSKQSGKVLRCVPKDQSNQEHQEYQRANTRTNSKNASSHVIRSGKHGQGSLSQWRFARMTQRLRQNTGCNNAAARSSSFLPGCFSCFSGSDGCQGNSLQWVNFYNVLTF